MPVPIKGSTGYGLMSLTMRPQPVPKQRAFDAINEAVELGVKFFNAGEFYGNDDDRLANLELLRDYFAKHPENREKMVVSVKGCVDYKTFVPNNTKENLEKSVEKVISFFPGKTVDIYEPARMDTVHPVEDVMKALIPFVNAKKIRGISLSEVGADTIRRAYKAFPAISCVEVEFSLMQRDILHNGINDACRELGIPIIAYSPLGRGFLTGEIKSVDDIPEGDFRRITGRLGSNAMLNANFPIVEVVLQIAKSKNCTPAQVALAWVRKHNEFPDKYAHIIPIPSGSSPKRVKENMAAVELSDDEFESINKKVAGITIKGSRYNEYAAKYLNV